MSNRKQGQTGAGSAGVQLGLIVTPMLDMAFQILAFFIMTYHPSALEVHIPGSLVPPEEKAQKGKENNPSKDPPLSVDDPEINPELNEAILVRVKAVGKGQAIGSLVEGQPSQFLIKTTTDTAPQLVADITVDVKSALTKLEDSLKAASGGQSKANIKLAGDGELRQQYMMQVYDACKRAGFSKIHFVPPPSFKGAPQ